jgi:hypothetical protein
MSKTVNIFYNNIYSIDLNMVMIILSNNTYFMILNAIYSSNKKELSYYKTFIN